MKALRELDIKNLGIWPFSMVAGLGVILGLFVLGLGYVFDIKKQMQCLSDTQFETGALKHSIHKKIPHSVNHFIQTEIQTIRKNLGGLLRQLPEQTEVPAIVEAISNQGLAVGLAFASIRIQPERVIDFYAELPIEISVEGDYHQFAEFVGLLGMLPRRVTLHDFVIHAKDQNTDKLIMSVTAKTYRYLGETLLFSNEIESFEPVAYTALDFKSPFARFNLPPEREAINSEKRVGSIEKNGKRWILVQGSDSIVRIKR
jgi:type IV pilus assembly protein PilO